MEAQGDSLRGYRLQYLRLLISNKLRDHYNADLQVHLAGLSPIARCFLCRLIAVREVKIKKGNVAHQSRNKGQPSIAERLARYRSVDPPRGTLWTPLHEIAVNMPMGAWSIERLENRWASGRHCGGDHCDSDVLCTSTNASRISFPLMLVPLDSVEMAKRDFKILQSVLSRSRLCPRYPWSRPHRHLATGKESPLNNNADFVSIVDAPPRLVRINEKHSKIGIFLLALMPITAFALGTWQVQRLDWKTKLIARYEDRLVRTPLPLPPRIDPDAIHEFDYRRVYATGQFRHDKEMLIGPRTQDGKDGYMVVTPLEREDGSTILINRGWISKDKKYQEDRDPGSLSRSEVTVSGLLREPWKRNMFTPKNKPEEGKFYFPDVYEMAKTVGAEPVWIEETMTPDLLMSYHREAKGIPIGRAAQVNLRNNHFQYIFTWYASSFRLPKKVRISYRSLGIR